LTILIVWIKTFTVFVISMCAFFSYVAVDI
jgi:hypothetical protein